MAHLSEKCGNSDGHSAYYYWGFLSHSLGSLAVPLWDLWSRKCEFSAPENLKALS